MKRVATLVAAISVVGTAGLGSSYARTAQLPAVLRFLDTAPATFGGARFKPHERVRVVFVGSTRAVRKTAATARGTFTVRFPGADVDSCMGFSATATGDRGSVATFKRARGQCAAP
jgi:hypothetical protein